LGSPTREDVDLATVSGVVLAQDGAPLPGVTLTLARADGSESRRTATGGGGVFRLHRVAPGTWMLGAASPGFAPGRVQLTDLRPGESRQVTITLSLAALLRPRPAGRRRT
jgi:hypothetical protein